MSMLTYWEHDEGISKLAEYAVRRNLIPFYRCRIFCRF